MTAERPQEERDYLASLDDRLRSLLAELTRINRRIRNARVAIRTLEDDLAGLCDEVAVRLKQLQDGGAERRS